MAQNAISADELKFCGYPPRLPSSYHLPSILLMGMALVKTYRQLLPKKTNKVFQL